MIHRYGEYDKAVTWVVMDKRATFDPATGHHDICSSDALTCYARTIYFVLSTLTTTGYGDITAWTEDEFLFEQVVCILGGMLNGLLCGAFTNILLSTSTPGTELQRKLQEVRRFISYRSLSPQLAESILAQYQHSWNKQRSIGGEGRVTDQLSKPLALELLARLHRAVLTAVPLFRNSVYSKRIAHALKPLIVLRDRTVYAARDPTDYVYFVNKGVVRISIPEENDGCQSSSGHSLSERIHLIS